MWQKYQRLYIDKLRNAVNKYNNIYHKIVETKTY